LLLTKHGVEQGTQPPTPLRAGEWHGLAQDRAATMAGGSGVRRDIRLEQAQAWGAENTGKLSSGDLLFDWMTAIAGLV
jgi:hypothetical protein